MSIVILYIVQGEHVVVLHSIVHRVEGSVWRCALADSMSRRLKDGVMTSDF